MAVTNVKMTQEEWEAFKKKTGYREESQPDKSKQIPDSPAKKEYKNYTQKFTEKYKERAAKDKEIRENVEQVKHRQEDRDSVEYWRGKARENKEKDHERPERERERPEHDRDPRNNTPAPKPARHDNRQPARQKPQRRKNKRPGVKLPVQAMNRVNRVSENLPSGGLVGGDLFSSGARIDFGGYRDPAAGAHLFGGGGGSRGYRDPFASQFHAPGRSSSGITGDLAGGIFGAYKSPFSGMFGPPPKRKGRK
jgi:hypothetical protein